MATDFDELERGGATLYANLSGIWAMILFGRPTKADMLLARPALVSMNKRVPRFPTLTWVLPEAGLSMDDDARKTAAAVTVEHQSVILAQATVIELGGFQGATVRAIIAGLDMMSRSACPRKVFAEVAPAVEWCAGQSTDVRASGREVAIAAQLRAMRDSLRVAATRPAGQRG